MCSNIDKYFILKYNLDINKLSFTNEYAVTLYFKEDLRDTGVKVVFPFPKSGLLCKEIITLRLLPHVIKGHTFSYRPSSHLKDLITIITISSEIQYRFKFDLSQGAAITVNILTQIKGLKMISVNQKWLNYVVVSYLVGLY